MYDNKKDALSEIFDIEGIHKKINSWSLLVDVTPASLLEVMSKTKYNLSTELNISPSTAVSIVHFLWPNKPRNNSKVCTWLFGTYGLKHCTNCDRVKDYEQFSKNICRPTGYNTHCKNCYLETTRDYQREYQKTRKALKLSRVPSWANIDKIREIYKKCPKGYHVDHIVPLQGKLVSGFHVEYNLQYLTAEANLKKHNKFDII